MPEPLLVVDVQNGFINTFTAHVPARIQRLIETGDFAPVLYTLFVNSPESPYRKLLRWDACAAAPDTELVPELVPLSADGDVYTKSGLTGVPEERLAVTMDFGEICAGQMAQAGLFDRFALDAAAGLDGHFQRVLARVLVLNRRG